MAVKTEIESVCFLTVCFISASEAAALWRYRSFFIIIIISAFSALTLLVGRHNGHLACERIWVLVCWWCRFHWNFARHIASDISTPLTPSQFWYHTPCSSFKYYKFTTSRDHLELFRMYAYNVAAGAAPLTPLEELTALPRPPSWWGGLVAPFPRTLTPLLALGSSVFHAYTHYFLTIFQFYFS